MPTTPEVLNRHGGIGPIEVLREPEAEQQGKPDRHVGVAGEVGIDLDCVAIDPEQDIPGRVLPRRSKSVSDDCPADEVRDHDLLDEASCDQQCRSACFDSVRCSTRPELRKELRGPNDRPGDKLGKEREVHGEIEQRRRSCLLAMDIDDIADRLEGEERDTDRQDDVECGSLEPEGILQARHEEAVVLEHAEHGEIEDHSRSRESLAAYRLGLTVHRNCGYLVDQDHEGEKAEETPVPVAVEHGRGGEDQDLPRRGASTQRPAEGQHHGEEHRERERGKEHLVSNCARFADRTATARCPR